MKYWLSVITTIFLIFLAFIFVRQQQTKPIVLSIYDENSSVFNKFLPVLNQDEVSNKFKDLVDLTKKKDGTYGIYIKNLDSLDTFSYNESELFYGASLFKVPIAVAALKEIENGQLGFNDKVTYTQADFASGTGSINQSSYGTKFTVDELLDKLLKESDNSAQNMLMRILDKKQLQNAYGIITIQNYFYINNTLTPEQMANFFEQLAKTDYLTESDKELLLNKMTSTLFDDRISAGLDQNIKFSHKIGNWPDTGTWHDCGIAQRNNKKVVACVMSRGTTYEQFLEVAKETGKFVSLVI